MKLLLILFTTAALYGRDYHELRVPEIGNAGLFAGGGLLLIGVGVILIGIKRL